MAYLHRVLVHKELSNWIFLHLIGGWLVGASNTVKFSCNNRQRNFSMDNDASNKL